MVVERQVEYLVVQHERGQPAIEGDLARAGRHGEAAGIFLPDPQRVRRDLDALRGQQIDQVQQIRHRERAFGFLHHQRGGFPVVLAPG